jgi:phage shock protein PspC (stress-responsive transcriptional regulator)
MLQLSDPPHPPSVGYTLAVGPRAYVDGNQRPEDARWTYLSSNRGMTMTDIRSTFASQGLIRPREGRILGGVCAGLGRRFGLTPWISRLLFVLLLMVVPGSQLLIYPVLWILMPVEQTYPAPDTR